MTNLGLSKLKEFADNNFKFDENGRHLYEWVENTVGKEEIAHYYEQCLLFPLCFQKPCTADTLKPGLVWERVKTWNCLVRHSVPNRSYCTLTHSIIDHFETVQNSKKLQTTTEMKDFKIQIA